MMKIEFERITGLEVTEQEYKEIEKKYMASRIIDKHKWCRRYLNSLKPKPDPMLKRKIKSELRDWLENWQEGTHNDNATFDIFYEDGTDIRIDDLSYNGEKVYFKNIVNISIQNEFYHSDFFFFHIADLYKYKNDMLPDDFFEEKSLLVDDEDNYWKHLENKGYYDGPNLLKIYKPEN